VSGARVGVPADNLVGPTRARDPRQVRAIQRSVAAGAHPLAVAQAHGLSVRTVYRYLHDDREAETVRVGCWEAEFSVGGPEEPQRLTPWRRARDGR
jgi:hypothetical protein